MQVIKRDGSKQKISFDKITQRIGFLVEGIEYETRFGERLRIDSLEIAKDVCSKVANGVTTSQLDEYAAEVAAYKGSEHPDYDILAGRILISNNHKNSKHYKNFSDMMNLIHEENKTLSSEFMRVVNDNANLIDAYVNDSHNLDYKYLTYFGFKTLERSYLIKAGKMCERPQHMIMRVSLDLNRYNIKKAIECYEYFSNYMFTHATPTLFNSGSKYNQYSSCYLLGIHDSIQGMYKNLLNCAHISKWAGGIGIWVTKIRASGSIINSTQGRSSGINPLLKVYNEFAKHVNQGGKRKGSIAIYIEPWHADIWHFLELKRVVGKDEKRARDLFYALYIPDLFMKRLKQALENKAAGIRKPVYWSLMCPYESPGLGDIYGDEFERLYEEYEEEGKYREKLDILKLWDHIIDSQLETGGPYVLYKDHINNKSNQKNIGIIRSSNLCCEIVQYSNPDEISVCNLSSICLQRFVEKDEDGDNVHMNWDALEKVTGIIVRNINNVINQNFYTCIETMQSNFRHRPMAIGVQGLAETFFELRLPYESEGAQEMNRRVFECIHYAALKESCKIAEERKDLLLTLLKDKTNQDIAQIRANSSRMQLLYFKNREWNENCNDNASVAMHKEHSDSKTEYNNLYNEMNVIFNGNITDSIVGGLIHLYEFQYLNLDITDSRVGAYSSFIGSPSSKGILQFDMWPNPKLSGLWDWAELKQKIIKYGLANSQLTSQMPTASTAQIMGSTEAFEPITSNIYSRSVLSGSFMVVNKYLQNDLIKLGIWNEDLKNEIVEHRGSIENIESIPDDLKQLYKTAWDIVNKKYIEMSADRGAFIDQSQSFNWFIAKPDHDLVTKCHMYGWQCGLKTGLYYLRRKTEADAQQFTIDPEKQKNKQSSNVNNVANMKNIADVKNQAKENIVENEDNMYGDACPIGCDSCGA